jgi:hypothetical protein
MKKTYLLAITIIACVFFASLIAYYFIFTNSGSTFIVKSALSKYTRSKSVSIKKSEGSLARALVFHDIEIKDSKILRRSNFVRIQRLEVYFESFNLGGINVNIHNGRLQLPASGLIVFYGSLKKSILDGNIYSRGFDVEGLSGFFSGIKELKDISGSISGIDIYLKGTVSEPKFSGECRIEKLIRNGFSLSNCSVLFNLQLKDVNKEQKLNGTISLNSGTISGRKTALINLRESKISLLGGPKKVSLDLKGSSNVEGAKITIVLKGTSDKPELKLTSDPPLPQERLLVMLITGKSWKATEMALDKRQFSPDLVKDFVDYFVFSGSGSKIARQLGISDISVTFEQQKKGVAVKKAITEKIDASYAVEQSQAKEEMPTTTQKVGGEYKIMEGISVGAEKELKQENKPEVSPEEQKTNDKVMIKFKKTF